MKIVIVHGSPRKGNTYKATEVCKEEMRKHGEVEFAEIFLPKDLPEFCCGCMACFLKGKEKCPHAEYTIPILEHMISADALIFTTPVFALSLSGCMKSFLDHYAYIFIVHRSRIEMFKKKAKKAKIFFHSCGSVYDIIPDFWQQSFLLAFYHIYECIFYPGFCLFYLHYFNAGIFHDLFYIICLNTAFTVYMKGIAIIIYGQYSGIGLQYG